MNFRLLALLGGLLVMLATPAAAGSTGGGGIHADVQRVATVTASNVMVFDFNLYNCPAGEPMAVSWEAEQPDAPGRTSSKFGTFFISNGDNVVNLTLDTNGELLAGLSWVGTGTVTCGVVTVPVAGSGFTRSVNDIGSAEDDDD